MDTLTPDAFTRRLRELLQERQRSTRALQPAPSRVSPPPSKHGPQAVVNCFKAHWQPALHQKPGGYPLTAIKATLERESLPATEQALADCIAVMQTEWHLSPALTKGSWQWPIEKRPYISFWQ